MANIVIASEIKNFADYYKELVRDNSYGKEVGRTVCNILQEVKNAGDEALVALTNTYDRRDVESIGALKLQQDAIDASVSQVSKELMDALTLAASRITTYHQKQMPDAFSYKDDIGVELGMKWTAIESAGIYVPGGLASYPSSVLMNAIPAKVAGVQRITMMVPAPEGELNPLVLAAAKILDIQEVYTIGGAQALGALAYGTESIKPVDVIVGPGNAYVAEAKKQLYGIVGIDMVAGPSEILVLADAKNDAKWIAADLLSQAEHDTNARSILITDDKTYAESVCQAVDDTLKTLEREEIARESWEKNGLVVVVDTIEQSLPIIDVIAPEHLELCVDDPQPLADKVQHAGAIFMGRYTPEAIGDYMAGPSHVLPTSSTARFSSGLSVYDFLKRSSMIHCSKESFDSIAEATYNLAIAEGLGAHALSVKVRSG